MLRSILSAFARSFGRSLGYTAARRVGWLAIPVLIIVAILGMLEISGVSLYHIVAPGIPSVLRAIGM